MFRHIFTWLREVQYQALEVSWVRQVQYQALEVSWVQAELVRS